MKRTFWTTIAVLAATTLVYGQEIREAKSQELQVPESKCSGGSSCSSCPMRGNCAHDQAK